MKSAFLQLKEQAEQLQRFGAFQPRTKPFIFAVTAISFRFATPEDPIMFGERKWHFATVLDTPDGQIWICTFQDPLFGDFAITEIFCPEGIQREDVEAAMTTLVKLLQVQVAVKTGEFPAAGVA